MIELTHDPIDAAEVLKSVGSNSAGANILFLGTTRQFTGDDETIRLDYDGYREMAMLELSKLSEEAKSKWPVIACSIVHRLGTVELGEASVAVAVSTPHRADSFAAAEWILNELKKRVPIWKRDHRPDGLSQWQHPDSGRPTFD